jgi:hypothetical protein
MGIINRYKVIIAIVVPIIILVLIRSVGSNHFKSDAAKLALPSLDKINLIDLKNIETISGEKLIIILDNSEFKQGENAAKTINIPADSIVAKKSLKTILAHSGPVLLYSSEPALSARIWMVLSQLGIKDILIMTSETDNEVIKYKFRPDTLTGPEL